MTGQAKQLILSAKNICLIPSDYEPEAVPSALALFYTLKDLGKNANLILETLPERLSFLVPSLDFISRPKDFIIAIPKHRAAISNVYYENHDESLKVHITVEDGQLKKEDLICYFSEARPDLIITLGIQDFARQLEDKLDSFGFLLDSPIINIDNRDSNQKFGQAVLIEHRSLAEITYSLITLLDPALIGPRNASCLLAGMVLSYENFKGGKETPEAFAVAAALMQKGADHPQIIERLNKSTAQEIDFLAKIFQQITRIGDGRYAALLNTPAFSRFDQAEAGWAAAKMKSIGMQDDLLVLWKSHTSSPMAKGFFYSKNPEFLAKAARYSQGPPGDGWAFLAIPQEDLSLAKDAIINALSLA